MERFCLFSSDMPKTHSELTCLLKTHFIYDWPLPWGGESLYIPRRKDTASFLNFLWVLSSCCGMQS